MHIFESRAAFHPICTLSNSESDLMLQQTVLDDVSMKDRSAFAEEEPVLRVLEHLSPVQLIIIQHAQLGTWLSYFQIAYS